MDENNTYINKSEKEALEIMENVSDITSDQLQALRENFQRGVKLGRRAVFQRPQGQVQAVIGFRPAQGFPCAVVAQLFQRQIAYQQSGLVMGVLVQRFLCAGQRIVILPPAQPRLSMPAF